MKLGRKVDSVMDKTIKAFYVLVIAMIVFLGGLLISRGIRAQEIPPSSMLIQSQEGSAL